MKLEAQHKAQKLRRKGCSIKEIANILKVSKSSASLWVRNVDLSRKHKLLLSIRNKSQLVVEQRRSTRLRNENDRRTEIVNNAKNQICEVSLYELQLVGTVLYWAEGGKTIRNIVRFCNGDPKMIQMMMRFFREICNVPDSKFRGYIHIHSNLDFKVAERYWSKISHIPLNQFYKTYRKRQSLRTDIKNSLPYGTFEIYVCNTELFLKLTGWKEKIISRTVSNFMPD